METLRLVAGWSALVLLVLLGGYVLYLIYAGKINLKYVLSDKDFDASMGRFQILIFTFVVAFSFLYVVTAPAATGFPVVPASVLTMLGISGSAYLVSKNIDGAAPSDGTGPRKDQ